MLSLSARLIAFLLILEAMLGGLNAASLLSSIGGYDGIARALILGRGLLGALQFVGGWQLANRRPQGYVISRWALVAGAALTPLDVGLNLAPSPVYPWWRWQATTAYAIYAAGGCLLLLRAEARRREVRP